MKTTLNLHDELLAEAKAFAAGQRVSLTRLIEEGLRMRLRGAEIAPAVKRRAMPVSQGAGGMLPGLSGLSTRELMDAADDRAADAAGGDAA
ncbi:MAG: DUF2191 domain-containing protein [Betaproteobacteria bacterium]|nr:DUF2191 domain-containing protein [Betaproteobacteria bacterium]